MSPDTIRVSVGMPVYNGENYLEAALESIVAQTFSDFELVISDNASTDRTAEICRDYANQDARVRYYRNAANLGATFNHNRVMELARGDLFKLAAHDDLCAPTFLQRCVEALDGDPNAVLAYPRMKVMRRMSNDKGWVIADYADCIDTEAPEPHRRFADLIRRQYWGVQQIFGVIRTNALRRAGPFGDFHSADVAVLINLGLLGWFHEVPEHLFTYRLHSQQSIALLEGSSQAYYSWWNPNKNRRASFPTWRFLRVNVGAIHRARLPWREQILCHREVWRWTTDHRANLMRELASVSAQRSERVNASGEPRSPP